MKVGSLLAALMMLALALPLEARGQADDTSGGTGCEMPKPSDNAKVIVFSSERGEGLSTSTIGSQDVTVQTAIVMVERGSEPLYIVGLSSEAMIWRLQGEVSRIERLVLTSNT